MRDQPDLAPAAGAVAAVAPPERWYRRALRGAAAGCIATGAMSVVQFSGAEIAGRRPPPVEITWRVSRQVPGRTPRGSALYFRGVLLHVGFGAACGVLYALVAPNRFRALSGTASAAMIYTASYHGFLTAVGLHPRPSDDNVGRHVANVAGHAVYGAVLGEVMRRTDPH